jgi:hypothetical protein
VGTFDEWRCANMGCIHAFVVRISAAKQEEGAECDVESSMPRNVILDTMFGVRTQVRDFTHRGILYRVAEGTGRYARQ